MEPIIYQFARNQRITKFASLPNNQFLIYIEGNFVVALVSIIDEWLHMNIYADTIKYTFDVDDDYYSLLSFMNPLWMKWKEAGDITVAPIQPPNYV